MNFNEFRITPPTDDQLISAFRTICSDLAAVGSRVSFSVAVGPVLDQMSLADVPNNELLKQIMSAHTTILRQGSLEFEMSGCSFKVDVERADGFDTVSVSGQPSNQEQGVSFYLAVRKAFKQFDRARLLGRSVSAELVEFYDRRELVWQTKLDEQRLALEQIRRDLAAVAVRNARRQSCEELRKVIDQQRTRLKEDSGTNRRRGAIHMVFVTLALVTGLSTVLALYQGVIRGNVPDWSAIARVIFFAPGLLLSVLYYLRWQQKWAQALNDEEARLERLDVDVERANWVVEILLERKETQMSELPKELVYRLSGGLFDNSVEGPSGREANKVVR